ncbi:unnamed protein product [Malus baccata var. baccata]
MAFTHHPISILLKTSKQPKTSILKSPLPLPPFSSISLPLKPRNLSLLSRSRIPGNKGNYSSPPSAQVEPQEYQASSAADAFANFKASSAAHHRWEPISLRGHETATVAALAKKYGSDITVVVIDEQQKVRLSAGISLKVCVLSHVEFGYYNFEYLSYTRKGNLLERLVEGNKSTAIIGEVVDDLNLDLVVISMEAIHSKHIDANLLAELNNFIILSFHHRKDIEVLLIGQQPKSSGTTELGPPPCV